MYSVCSRAVFIALFFKILLQYCIDIIVLLLLLFTDWRTLLQNGLLWGVANL